MNDQERWVNLLQTIKETAEDLQRYPPEGDELDQVRLVERELEGIRWDCEDDEREEV